MGAGPIKTFFSITLPLSKTGIVAGSMLVFVPAVGEFVIPDLVGGSDNLMIGKVLWMTFFEQNNWPLASALAVVMVLLLVVPITFYHRYENRQLEKEGKMANKQKLSWFLKAMLFLGLAFLYIPLIVLVVYSFNDSKLVTIWGGFSTNGMPSC